MTGEWWITGRLEWLHADGDTGDNNHDSAASGHAQSILIDLLSGSQHEALQAIASALMGNDHDGDVVWMRSDILDISDSLSRDSYPELYDDPFGIMIQNGIDPDIIELATSEDSDGRTLAQKLWGWSAVRGNCIDTWGLTRRKMRDIGDTLIEIADEGGLSLMPHHEMTIDDFKTCRRYIVSIETLCQGDAESLFRQPEHVITA